MDACRPRCFWHLAVSDVHWEVLLATILAQAAVASIGLWYSFASRQAGILRKRAREAGVPIFAMRPGTPMAAIPSLQPPAIIREAWWMGDYLPHRAWVEALDRSGMFSVLIGSHQMVNLDVDPLPPVPDGWTPYRIGLTVLSPTTRPRLINADRR